MKIQMTKQGYDALREKLERLEKEELLKVQEKVDQARAFCDFSEDPMYQAFVNESTDLRDEIKELKHTLKHAEIVEAVPKEEVALGSIIILQEEGESEKEEYILVSPVEADIDAGRISTESPLGQAALGKKVGERVTLVLGDDEIHFTLCDIKNNESA